MYFIELLCGICYIKKDNGEVERYDPCERRRFGELSKQEVIHGNKTADRTDHSAQKSKRKNLKTDARITLSFWKRQNRASRSV